MSDTHVVLYDPLGLFEAELPLDRAPSMGTISYILREDTWGNGYATHAAQQVAALAFTTAGLTRLEAMHHSDNPASGRVLAEAGFILAGTSDQYSEDGSTVPYELYALEHDSM